MQSFRPCLKPLVSYLNSKNKTYSYPSSHPQPYWLYLGKNCPGAGWTGPQQIRSFSSTAQCTGVQPRFPIQFHSDPVL